MGSWSDTIQHGCVDEDNDWAIGLNWGYKTKIASKGHGNKAIIILAMRLSI